MLSIACSPCLAIPTLVFAAASPTLPALLTPVPTALITVVPNSPTIVPGHFSFAPLEVTYHKVDCDIKDQVAVTTVDQEFYNPNGGQPLEGDYIFPIPKDGQINKFAMEIDGKPVEAELLPAEKAREIYNEIVRKTKDPALLEYAWPRHVPASTSSPSNPTAKNASSSNTPNSSSRTTACSITTTPSTPKNTPASPSKTSASK